MAIQNIQSWQPPEIKANDIQAPEFKDRAQVPREGIGKEFSKFLNDVNTSQLQAEHLMTEYANGRQNDLHGTMIAVEKADITFRLLANIRNKALEAYREVMRMGG